MKTFISFNQSGCEKNPPPKKFLTAFTFIELLISLTIIAITFLPLMHMYSTGLEQLYFTSELDTARYLAQEGMEKLKNLYFTEAQIKNLGDVWAPPLDAPPLELNNRSWRVLRRVKNNTDPLEVEIQVFQEPIKADSIPIIKLVTLIEDLEWTDEE